MAIPKETIGGVFLGNDFPHSLSKTLGPWTFQGHWRGQEAGIRMHYAPEHCHL